MKHLCVHIQLHLKSRLSDYGVMKFDEVLRLVSRDCRLHIPDPHGHQSLANLETEKRHRTKVLNRTESESGQQQKRTGPGIPKYCNNDEFESL